MTVFVGTPTGYFKRELIYLLLKNWYWFESIFNFLAINTIQTTYCNLMRQIYKTFYRTAQAAKCLFWARDQRIVTQHMTQAEIMSQFVSKRHTRISLTCQQLRIDVSSQWIACRTQNPRTVQKINKRTGIKNNQVHRIVHRKLEIPW